MISKINFFIAPSIEHKLYVKYRHPNVNVIDWSSIWSHFFYWSQRNGKHHWLPTEAIRFLQFACVDEGIDLHLNENTNKIVLNADGKNIGYYIPKIGEYKITEYNGNITTGDSSILYNLKNPICEYALYPHRHCISTINRTDYSQGLKLLLIADSMALPWVLCLAPICSTLTYIDNRDYKNLSQFHLNDYDKCFGLMVNHQRYSVYGPQYGNRFVPDAITYFANQIKAK